jgi:single-strand DNA-binding protein
MPHLNSLAIEGRIPFDLEIKNPDDDAKAFLGFSISTQRSYKPEGDQYYPEDLLYCKAFRQTAKFISTYFKKGDTIILDAEVRRDDDYPKDGETVHGQMYIYVNNAYFAGGSKNSSEDSEKPAKAAPKSTKPASGAKTNPFSSNPLAGGAPKKNPFAK